MTSKALSFITAALAVITALAALDISGIVSLIPGAHDGLVAIIAGSLATLGTILRAIGDFMDDGKVNGSYGKFQCHPLAFLAAAVITLALSSCAGLTVTASLPWGEVSSSDGETEVILRPIILPTK